MRASDSSRPSRARLSKMPAETVFPVIATRIGWNTAPGFAPSSSDHAPQRLLDVLLVERLASRERRAGALQRVPGAVLGHHLVPGGRVDLHRARRRTRPGAGTPPASRSSPGPPPRPARAADRSAPGMPRCGHQLGGHGRVSSVTVSISRMYWPFIQGSFCSSNTAGERDTRSRENFSISSSVVKKVVVSS